MQIGRKIIHLERIDSTNNFTANLVKKKEITHGTVILADDQYEGKGQRGAKWHVEPGSNLTCSIFLDNVRMSVEQSFQLTIWFSLCVVDLLKKFNLNPLIKWPNDIYVGSNKIAGILLESQISGFNIKSVIIGLGLNVNQVHFDGFLATSIKLETGKYFQLSEVLLMLLDVMNTNISQLESNFEKLKESYLNRLYGINETRIFKDAHGEFQGQIVGVEVNGKLTIRRQNGDIMLYDIKEIQFDIT